MAAAAHYEPVPVVEGDRNSGFLASYADHPGTPQPSFAASANNSQQQLTYGKPEAISGSPLGYPLSEGTASNGKRRWWPLIALATLAIIAVAVVVPVYFTVIKPKQSNSSPASSSSSSGSGTGSSGQDSGGKSTSNLATTGGDGSVVTMEDGSTFTYNNKFGGYWVSEPSDPFNNGARPNTWTPALNETWNWETDRIHGVNLGGLFVLEPFISPALFQKYPSATDEWTLSEAMAADTASGGLNQLEDHYNTFITEKDIAEIAGAGLNWIRLPIPFWAIDKWDGEPFLEKVSWKYILRLLGWARKYGIRVNLDLHTIPGSQNGYNHSGKGGQINFLHGTMGYANAQRALNYIRIITEFISQPEYKDLIPMFGIVNEALVRTIGDDSIRSFYLEVHNMIRGITGSGEGNGPFISIHEGFLGLDHWADFLPGADRINLDIHPYLAFSGNPNMEPIATGTGADAGGQWPAVACNAWGPGMNTSRGAFGVAVAGEFSNGYNDCGLFLTGPQSTGTNNQECDLWDDWTNWNQTIKAGVQAFAEASMDALGDWFFWTWKIGNSSTSGRVEAPLWSYQLGLENGWMPTDPRTALGKCAAVGAQTTTWDGTFEPNQIGGSGAGTIAASATNQYPWPPASISDAGQPTTLPAYTSTGTVNTLPPPTFTASVSVSVGNGWFNAQDTGLAPTTIPGCAYPDPWNAVDAAVPANCAAGAAGAGATPTPAAITSADAGEVTARAA